MEKVIIIGCSGSGKSTFGRKLKQINLESRPKVINLLEKYSSKNIIIFQTRTESEKYLSLLESKSINNWRNQNEKI